MSTSWKVGNYINKDGKGIAWVMPADKDINDPKQRHHGISPSNVLKVLKSLPQTAEVVAVKSIAEQCTALLGGNKAAIPPLPGAVMYYVAYTDATGQLTQHDKELTATDVAQFMGTHSNVIVCKVGGRSWEKPADAGIAPVATAPEPPALPPALPVIEQPPSLPTVEAPELLPPLSPDTPPSIPMETAELTPPPISTGDDLMQRVMAKRKAS